MLQQTNDVLPFPCLAMVTGKAFRVQSFVDFDQNRGSGFEGQQTTARGFFLFRLFRVSFAGCFESFGSKWQSAGGGGRGGGSGSRG